MRTDYAASLNVRLKIDSNEHFRCSRSVIFGKIKKKEECVVKVIVIGANGQVGKHIVRLLEADSNYSVTAMVRKEEQKKAYEENGVKAVLGNLEDGVDELTKVIEGHDAVIFTAGSGSKTGPDKTLLVDLDGAVKSMEAAEK